MRVLLPATFLLAAALAGCMQASDSAGGGSGGKGSNAGADGTGSDPGTQGGSGSEAELGPAWRFTDTDGEAHSRDSSIGAPSLLFFMASWCGSCRSLTGPLANVHAAYAERGLQMYSLTFDSTDDAQSLEEWKARYNQPWPHGLDPDFQTQRTFGITSQSSIVILDPNGQVVQKWGYGGASEQAIRAKVDEAFSRGA